MERLEGWVGASRSKGGLEEKKEGGAGGAPGEEGRGWGEIKSGVSDWVRGFLGHWDGRATLDLPWPSPVLQGPHYPRLDTRLPLALESLVSTLCFICTASTPRSGAGGGSGCGWMKRGCVQTSHCGFGGRVDVAARPRPDGAPVRLGGEDVCTCVVQCVHPRGEKGGRPAFPLPSPLPVGVGAGGDASKGADVGMGAHLVRGNGGRAV